jgi:hypothetical protein
VLGAVVDGFFEDHVDLSAELGPELQDKNQRRDETGFKRKEI